MKKVVCACLLALFSVILCSASFFYVAGISNQAEKYLEEIEKDLENRQYDIIQDKLNKLEQVINNSITTLSIILHHDVLTDIEESIEVVKTLLKDIDDDNAMDLKTEISKLKLKFINIRESETPNFAGII